MIQVALIKTPVYLTWATYVPSHIGGYKVYLEFQAGTTHFEKTTYTTDSETIDEVADMVRDGESTDKIYKRLYDCVAHQIDLND